MKKYFTYPDKFRCCGISYRIFLPAYYDTKVRVTKSKTIAGIQEIIRTDFLNKI